MGALKILTVTAVGLGVLAAAGVVVVKSPVGQRLMGAGDDNADAQPVMMDRVVLGDLSRTVSAPGSIEPKRLIKISSQVSAKILALPFEEGQPVREGDVVIRLDPQNLVAALDAARAGLSGQEASLVGADAALINARVNYERLQQLLETGDVTQADLDGSRAAFLQAQSNKQVLIAQIEQARAQIDRAQKDLDNTTIASPIDGVITSLNAEVGETVIVGTTNNPGSIIMEIADLSEMLLKAQVDEANIAPIRAGQEARIYINAYTERQYEGKVQKIALKRQVAADGTGTFEVEILMKLPEGETLRQGLSASTDIVVEHFYDAMIVPSQAVVDRRIDELPPQVKDASTLIDLNKTFTRIVYRVVEGKTVATAVEVGPSDLTQTVITRGLNEGDTVVTGPYRVLVDLKHDRAVRDENAEKDKDNDNDNGKDMDNDKDKDAAENNAPDSPSDAEPMPKKPADDGASSGTSSGAENDTDNEPEQP